MHWRRRRPTRRTGAPQQGDFACLEFMHANYPTPRLAARGENGLYQAEVQLNFFTLPQFASSALSDGGETFDGVRKTLHQIDQQGRLRVRLRPPLLPVFKRTDVRAKVDGEKRS